MADLQVTQVASARSGWVERVLTLDAGAGIRNAPQASINAAKEVLRAQVSQNAHDRDAILSWVPGAWRYVDIVDRFLDSVVPAYGHGVGAPVIVEYVLKGDPDRLTFALPVSGPEIGGRVQARKITARDVLGLVLVNVGDDICLDIELSANEEPCLCSVVLRKIVLPVVAPFVTVTHSDLNMVRNGEFAASALSDDPAYFKDSLALAAPLPVEF